jgi:hypothetical protein
MYQGMRRESCITEKNILRKERLSYSNYRHAKHGGRQGNYGWYSYSNYFRNIAEGATVVRILFALNEFIFKASDNGQLYIDAATKQQGNFKTWR